jgi:nickel superoxide dismutase
VYDPEQARIEAESCPKINEKYAANEDATFRTRAIAIKEGRADLVKHHLDVLWHDYFKPEHLAAVPNLHELFWNANKQVSKVKASTDTADSKQLLDMIDEIDAAWKATGGNEKTRVAGRPS